MAKATISRQALVEALAALEAQRGGGDPAFVRAVETALAAVRDRLAEAQAEPDDRRQRELAVLVADLCGFTALSEGMDAEKVRDALNAMWAVLDAVIAAHGGRIDQHAGDSLAALFGLPQPRGEDAARALRAALAMQTELALFNERVRAAAEAGTGAPWAADWPGPDMRIGVHSGPVYFAQAASGSRLTAVGDTTAVARRLERAAPAGQVLTSTAVRQRAQARFRLLPAPEAVALTVRRTPDEEIFLVEGERPAAPSFAPSPVAGQVTRLVGRTEELDRLELALQSAVDSAAPQMVTLAGAPGVGASRLVYEFEGRARLSHGSLTVLHATAPADAAAPYALLRDLLLRRFDVRPQHSRYIIADRLRHGLRELVRPGYQSSNDGAENTLTLLEQLLDVRSAAELSPEAVRSQVERLLTATAASGPLLVVLEGLHRADGESLALVEGVVTGQEGMPVLFVGIEEERDAAEESAILPPRSSDPFSPFTRIELGPLSPVEGRLMATDIVGRLLSPPMRLLDLVVAESGGNPLYIEAFVRWMMEEGVLILDDGRGDAGRSTTDDSGRHWQADMARLERLRLPAGLSRLIEARLAGLPEVERRVLRAAAVTGRLFWDATLTDTRPPFLADLSPGEIEAALAELEARRYIVRDPAYSFGATQAYTFRRQVAHAAAYRGLPAAERRAQHRRVAQWLIAARQAGPVGAWLPIEAMIARHFAAGEGNRG